MALGASVGSGSGGGTGRFWDSSILPVDAALDATRSIDFGSLGSLTGYTQVNFGTSTAALRRKRLIISAQGNGGTSTSRRLLYPPSANQPPTSGSWCIQSRTILYGAGYFNLGGLWIKGSDANKGLMIATVFRSDVGQVCEHLVERLASVTSATTDLSQIPAPHASCVAVGWDGTNFLFYSSPDGREWRDDPWVTEAASSFLGTGPYTYALMADSNSAKSSLMGFENVAFLNQSTPIPHGQFV